MEEEKKIERCAIVFEKIQDKMTTYTIGEFTDKMKHSLLYSLIDDLIRQTRKNKNE